MKSLVIDIDMVDDITKDLLVTEAPLNVMFG